MTFLRSPQLLDTSFSAVPFSQEAEPLVLSINKSHIDVAQRKTISIDRLLNISVHIAKTTSNRSLPIEMTLFPRYLFQEVCHFKVLNPVSCAKILSS
jgi:hypothetical protein